MTTEITITIVTNKTKTCDVLKSRQSIHLKLYFSFFLRYVCSICYNFATSLLICFKYQKK